MHVRVWLIERGWVALTTSISPTLPICIGTASAMARQHSDFKKKKNCSRRTLCPNSIIQRRRRSRLQQLSLFVFFLFSSILVRFHLLRFLSLPSQTVPYKRFIKEFHSHRDRKSRTFSDGNGREGRPSPFNFFSPDWFLPFLTSSVEEEEEEEEAVALRVMGFYSRGCASGARAPLPLTIC